MLSPQYSFDLEHGLLDRRVIRHLHCDLFDVLAARHSELRSTERDPDVIVGIAPAGRSFCLHGADDRKRDRTNQDIAADH